MTAALQTGSAPDRHEQIADFAPLASRAQVAEERTTGAVPARSGTSIGSRRGPAPSVAIGRSKRNAGGAGCCADSGVRKRDGGDERRRARVTKRASAHAGSWGLCSTNFWSASATSDSDIASPTSEPTR